MDERWKVKKGDYALGALTVYPLQLCISRRYNVDLSTYIVLIKPDDNDDTSVKLTPYFQNFAYENVQHLWDFSQFSF